MAAAPGGALQVQPKPTQHQHEGIYAGVSVQVNRCPFGHGSVGAGPYPGYVHGRHPAICREGCRPDIQLGKYGHQQETPKETLVREALEYQELYHRDKGTAPVAKQARMQQVLAEIESTGTYTHTFDELEHGARVAWRNAPKCSNRKFWQELRLIDGRGATTPSDMFATCLNLLERAGMSCVTTTNIAVFRPQTPGTSDGPRVWNNQLIRYAGYRQPGTGEVLGDPAEADFTDMLVRDFGWQPPANRSAFDVLPLLLQADSSALPQLFEIPSQYVVRVPIRHPTNDAISALGLQWYAVPAVSSMELSVGGITYTAAPFNGWYADTEVVRNLTDSGRYNMCADVAACLGLDTRSDASMWRDRVILEISVAVMHSFKEAGMVVLVTPGPCLPLLALVDHHTLMRNFFTWWNKEMAVRGFCPGNWKWLITPLSPTTTDCYLGLNKMTEYTIKPNYWYGPGWRQYRQALLDQGLLPRHPVPSGSAHAPGASTAKAQPDAVTVPGESPSVGPVAVAAAAAAQGDKLPMVLAYATVTGTTQQHAEALVRVLQEAGTIKVHLLNLEDFDADTWAEQLGAARVVVLLSSTYGAGACPATAVKFMSWLKNGNSGAGGILAGKPFGVLGFGSTSYPRFCAAADSMHSAMLSTGATALLPPGKADAVAGEEGVLWPWLQELVQRMHDKGWLSSSAAAGVMEHIPASNTGKPLSWKPINTLIHLKGQGLQPASEAGCCWATVKRTTELLGPDCVAAGDSTKLLVLDVQGVRGGTYSAGDDVAIWAENDSVLVADFASKLGIPAQHLDDMFMLQRIQGESGSLVGPSLQRFPLPNSFRTVLTRYAGLGERITFSAMPALASCAPDDPTLQQLLSSYNKFAAWAAENTPMWGELFSLFPVLVGRIPLATFFTIVPLLKPRYYSVASSSAASPQELALMVGRLAYRLPSGGFRPGFCSSFLTGIAPGTRIRFKLVSQPSFRLPFNPSAPVVMIAAGTGLAPFKGFIEERAFRLQQQQQLGPGVLLFGCRSQGTNYLLRGNLPALLQGGAMSRVLTAFSRQQGVPRAYVQDLVQLHAEELGPLLTHPQCHLYVAGSSKMSEGVSRALQALIGTSSFTRIVEDGRLHEAVFGGTGPSAPTSIPFEPSAVS